MKKINDQKNWKVRKSKNKRNAPFTNETKNNAPDNLKKCLPKLCKKRGNKISAPSNHENKKNAFDNLIEI